MNRVPGDIFDIATRIKNIDPELELNLNRDTDQYTVTRRGRHIMSIELGELDARVLTKLRKNDLTRRRLMDFILELERSEEDAEKQKAKELRNFIEAATLDQYDRIVGIPTFALGGI